MRTPVGAAIAAASLLALAAPAFAQAPSTPPPPPDYGAPINAEQARTAAAAAIAEMKKNNWKMAVAVMDSGGNLVHFEKVDGTQHGSIEIAQKKARASVQFRRNTKAFVDALAGNPGLPTLPGVIISEGGVLILAGGKIIGSLGCSGGTGQQDGVACNAGAAAVK